ncbi:hypothetical protein [Peribacillus simplex]|uniref:XRE family transcriptional regulator n=1 Tax=Peribacillus simplex TaxID=1478 RepID=A0AAW7II76_9BACI|nr:hypothetical protein [Peribacillus simplex]MDM5450966.1 hypothetical protein [Peribacillus simplex]
MSIGWRVTASDIKVWTESNKRKAEELLPLLVKKLIIASSSPDEIHFPSGDSVAVGGLDGELKVDKGNAFIPTGNSVWEFGTNKQVKGKADGDYTKRTEDPGDIKTKENTFVFVTSRTWSNKNDWVTEKRKEKIWKDIKGINADDIEAWLELCPAVHRWFANILGKRVEFSWDVIQAWESWAKSTSPPLNEQIVLNGRDEQKKNMIEQLKVSSTLIRVKCQSEEEAYAFILATLKDNTMLSPKTLIIKEQNAWDTIIDTLHPLILIPYKFTPENIGYAKGKGHNVVLAELESFPLKSSDLRLEKMSRSDRIIALKLLGLSETDAEKVYKDTRGYLEIIKRHTLLTPQDRVLPRWVNKYDTKILFSIFCATEWNRKLKKDISVLSKISHLSYDELEQKLSELKNEEEPPIRLVGDVWQLISKIDFWSLISHKVDQRYIESLKEIVVEVLGEPDLSNSSNQGYLIRSSSVMSEQYSDKIKTGIADTLALLASLNADYAGNHEYYSFNELINYYVKILFENYGYFETWHNLREHFVSLAEASPDIFLSQLEKELHLNPPTIAKMFEDQHAWECTHATLLWSLELISWDLNYFTRVVNVLAGLCEVDPGGRYSNRPSNSLKEIFIGWTINTNASLEQRLQIIDKVLIENFPKISWDLMISLLPNNSTISSSIHKPKYRDWIQSSENSVLIDQYIDYINGISMKVVDLAQLNPDLYYKDLIENLENLSLEACEYALECLTIMNKEDINDELTALIYNELRNKIARHKEYLDCDWALPIELINKLELLYKKFEPKSTIAKIKYLFDDNDPEFIMPLSYDRNEYEIKQKCINQERTKSLILLYEEEDFSGITKLIEKSMQSRIVGQAIACSSLNILMEENIINWLDSTEEKFLNCAKAFVYTMSNNNDEWVEKIIGNFRNFEENIQLNFLLSLKFSLQIFNLIEQLKENLKILYWLKVPWHAVRVEGKDANLIIEKLVSSKRSLASLKIFSSISYTIGEKSKIDSNLLAEALLNIEADQEYNKLNDLGMYLRDIRRAIEYLQQEESLDNQVIAQIEWFYLPLFKHHSFRPIFLEKDIIENPDFFVQVLSWCTISKAEINPGKRESRLLKLAAASLLDSLSMLPGQDSKNNIDYKILKDWVTRARNTLKDLEREKIGDHEIGKLLVKAPVGTDNIWPHEAVRKVIEDVQSSDIEKSLEMGILNGRGVTVRSPYEGGKQEIELAKIYLQNSIEISLIWPRTGRILRNISESYNKAAWREDIEVELRD